MSDEKRSDVCESHCGCQHCKCNCDSCETERMKKMLADMGFDVIKSHGIDRIKIEPEMK